MIGVINTLFFGWLIGLTWFVLQMDKDVNKSINMMAKKTDAMMAKKTDAIREVLEVIGTLKEAMFGKTMGPDEFMPGGGTRTATPEDAWLTDDDSGVPLNIDNCMCGHRQDWHTADEDSEERKAKGLGYFNGNCRMQNCDCQKFRSIKHPHQDDDVVSDGNEIH